MWERRKSSMTGPGASWLPSAEEVRRIPRGMAANGLRIAYTTAPAGQQSQIANETE